MTLYRALDVALDEDLSAFSAILRARDIEHRVVEDSGRQVIAVASEAHVLAVREAYLRWRSGELKIEPPPGNTAPPIPSLQRLADLLRMQPVTLCVAVLCVGGFAVVALEWTAALRWLAFADFRWNGSRLAMESGLAAYARGEYWRLLTPVFLHFGLLHVIFNVLWLWEFGSRLERVRGSVALLAVLLLTGVGGNMLQYMAEPRTLFGGMSGVIYGLLGYIWMWNRLGGNPAIPLRPGVLPFMLVWLVVCMSGIFEAIGFGKIANAAHLAGLFVGMLLGVGAAMVRDRGQDRAAPG